MPTAYEKLESRFRRLAQIDHATTFLHWDQQVMMPAGGNEARGKALAELTTLYHELLTAPDMGGLLHEAETQVVTPGKKKSVKEMMRSWQKAACLPSDLVRARSLAGTRCEHGWREQRPANDWTGFLENFREVVRLSGEEAVIRQEAGAGRFETPYDALLDLYCTGENGELIQTVFDVLKHALPKLISEVRERQQAHAAGIAGRFPIEDQMTLNRELMSRLGFDHDAGRLDISAHPFSTGVRGDHRITSRFRDTEFTDALQATAHESGHAAYESGLPEEWEGLPVGRARNMCIHESQSLLFENHIFLTKPFMNHFAAAIHQHLQDARDLSGEQLWRDRIRVQPGLIRIAADEVTYPLHVILRFEIERRLINGTMAPEDIPDAWDKKMTAYLGLSTKDDYRDGCLQDIHWTDGSFGYFPAYTMGALNAAQFSAALRRQHPDWWARLSAGEVGFIRDWLAENIWRKGSLLESQEIVETATGEKTNAQYFLDHIWARYIDRDY